MRQINLTTFWNNVKTLRKFKRISQQEIATKLGITQATYNRYERGNSNTITESMVNTLCLVLDCNREDLFGYTELTIGHFPLEVQFWLSQESSKKYILEAYSKYLLER